MMGMMKRQPSASHWWWFESHQTSRRSPWLQSTLDELDQKIEAMLRLIEEDADSFARRAEMYYKKRPELISMVEEFYRAHRSLAERYDQVKSDSGNRLLTTLGSPFCSMKTRLEKSTSGMDQTYDSCSETCDREESADPSLAERYDQGKSDSGIRLLTTLGSPFCSMKTRLEKSTSGMDQTYDSCSETCDREESAESEVDDPEQEDDNVVDKETKDEEVSSEVSSDQVMKLKEELQRLEEENRIQKDQLKQKDEEKREAIRQLCIAVDVLKEENVRLRKCLLVRDSPKKSSPFEFSKLKETLLGKLFNGSQKHHPTTIVAL